MIRTIRTVCAHDCPDQCSLLAHVEDGRIVRIEGDPEHPFTAGFACTKVHHDHELVHSPERVRTPLRRAGAKGEGRFVPVTWDEALDEIVGRWQAIMREDGPGGDPRLRLQRPPGPVQPRPHARAVPRPRHEPAPGRHRVRHLRGGRMGRGLRQRGRRRPGDGRALRPDHRVGGRSPHDERPHLALRRAGAQGGRHPGRHRAAPESHRRPRRLAPARERRDRRRPRPGGDARARPRRDSAIATTSPRRTVGFERLEREVLPRFHPARVAEITGRQRGRPRAPGPPVRPRPGALHPAGRGHVALAPGRPGHPRRGAAARAWSAPTTSWAGARSS